MSSPVKRNSENAQAPGTTPLPKQDKRRPTQHEDSEHAVPVDDDESKKDGGDGRARERRRRAGKRAVSASAPRRAAAYPRRPLPATALPAARNPPTLSLWIDIENCQEHAGWCVGCAKEDGGGAKQAQRAKSQSKSKGKSEGRSRGPGWTRLDRALDQANGFAWSIVSACFSLNNRAISWVGPGGPGKNHYFQKNQNKCLECKPGDADHIEIPRRTYKDFRLLPGPPGPSHSKP